MLELLSLLLRGWLGTWALVGGEQSTDRRHLAYVYLFMDRKDSARSYAPHMTVSSFSFRTSVLTLARLFFFFFFFFSPFFTLLFPFLI